MTSLENLLAQYTAHDEHEAAMVARLRDFLVEVKNPEVPNPGAAFGRELVGPESRRGHVTGSAWVINATGSRVVLVHHAKLGRWVQPGGHADGETDVLAVARREALEETGLAVVPHGGECGGELRGIFDVDVHSIPEYWNTPAHLHYDVRFLLQADDRVVPRVSAESRAVRWVTLDEAETLARSRSITRMIEKTRMLAIAGVNQPNEP